MAQDACSDADISSALHELLLEGREITEFLADLARLSSKHLSGKHNAVVASSSPDARQMDDVQAGFDEGPCLDAQRHDTVIRVPDVAYETRWLAYMDGVRHHGLHSILAVPLRADGSARAALNLYTRRPGAFDPEGARTTPAGPTATLGVHSDADIGMDTRDICRRCLVKVMYTGPSACAGSLRPPRL